MKILATAIIITLLCCSCDPGHQILVINHSNKQHKITYIESAGKKLIYKDSLYTTDTSGIYNHKIAQWIKVVSDTLSQTYTFVLLPKKAADVDHGMGRLSRKYLDQKIVIDDLDTIRLKDDKRVKVSGNFMHTKVEVSIK